MSSPTTQASQWSSSDSSSSSSSSEQVEANNALAAVKWIHYHQIEDNHDDSKILVCGSGQQIHRLLDMLESIGESATIKRIICAANSQLATLTDSKFWTQYGCRIVSWREAEYEEDMIRRTRQAAKQKPISTVIDFEPTLRRLHRLFYLIDEGGRVLLYQKRQARWDQICAPLLPALAERCVTVENLEDDCCYLLPPAAAAAAAAASSSDGGGGCCGSDVSEDLAYSSSVSSNEFLECDR